MLNLTEGDFYKTNKGHIQIIGYNPLEAWGIYGVTDKGKRESFEMGINGLIHSTINPSDPDCVIITEHLPKEKYPELYL